MSHDKTLETLQGRYILRWIAFVTASLMSTTIALLLLGAYSTRIPYLSVIGAMLFSFFAPWFALIPLASAAVIWAAALPRIRRLQHGLTILALLVAAVGAVGVSRMIAVARENSVPINLLSTLSVRIIGKVPPDHFIDYAAYNGQPVHMAIYDPPPQRTKSPAPILIYVHGGGFTEGDPLDAGEMLRWFAKQGWLVLSAGYPLSSPQHHHWDQTTSQIGCALAWTNANAAQYGGDPQRISMLGHSAGGNLVLDAASQANAGTLSSSCQGSVLHVAAVIAVYPAVHLAEAYHNRTPWISDVGRTYLRAYTGGSPEQFPDRYAYIDPAFHISHTNPPTLILVGTHDDLLPPQPTYRFVDDLRAAGVAVQLVRFPYGQHAYDVVQGSVGNQLTLGMTRKFLIEHGEGPTP